MVLYTGVKKMKKNKKLTYLTFYLLRDGQILSGQRKASDLGELIVSALPQPFLSPGNGGDAWRGIGVQILPLWK